MQIGGYNLKKYSQGPLTWYDVKTKYWGVSMKHIKVGDLEFEPTVPMMMVDSGTSLNMIPNRDYFQIFNHWIKPQMDCHVLPNTLHGCWCTEEQHKAMPNIEFDTLGDKYIINRDQWIERGDNGLCVVKFMRGPRAQ